MTAFVRRWYGLLAITMLIASLGLLIRNANSQEGREEPRPVVVSEEASADRPSERREARGREERVRAEAREGERSERPTERDVLRQQVEVLEIALHGLREARRMDAAEVVQRAIRAREVTLEGRRDDEAHMIRERAPSREQLAEILRMAAGVWREFKNEDKAAVVGRAAESLAGRPGEREVRRERAEEAARERTERPDEREVARRQLEVMRVALPALREANRADAVEWLQRAIRAYEVRLEGRTDAEAHQIRERMPNRGQMAEVLTAASNLWREFNNHDKAEVVGRLAREFGGGGPRERERERPVSERRGSLHELEQAFVRAREAGKEDEAARIKRQMEELARQAERRPARRPAATEARRTPEEVERLKGTVRELSGQVNELRREMAEMRRLLERLVEQKREER
jgi:hypothetical protein